MIISYQDPLFARPTRRMMIFADGENLVFRFQEMIKQGFVQHDGVLHRQDSYVWTSGFSHLALQHEILRATYYTYAIGDAAKMSQVKAELQQLTFLKHMASRLPNNLTPHVFKKENRSRSGKGVDIQLCVDVLTHVYRKNVDSVLLLSGDGDYVPLLQEVRRAGVLVYLSAFSSGFNPVLREHADDVYELDGTTWLRKPGEA